MSCFQRASQSSAGTAITMIQSSLVEISKMLTEEVLVKAFKMKTNSKDTIKSVRVSRAAPAGEGMIGAVYRIQVYGNLHSTSFVVKGLVQDPILRKALNCDKFFEREVDFFSRILPVLVDLQKSLGARETIQNYIPNCYGCYYDGCNDYILLEDLTESGCRSLPDTPSEEEKNGVLRTLAHLHATSMALRLKRPEEFIRLASYLQELYYNERNRDWYCKYLRSAIDIDREVLEEYEDPKSVYLAKFNEVFDKPDVYGQYIESVSRRGDHPVFCHADAWCPNFLASSERTVVIDFQMFRCASPATDLAYWLIMCCNHRTVKQDFLNSVDVYYSYLEYYLRDMGLNAPEVFPRHTLYSEIKLYGKYGFLASMTTIPLVASQKFDTLASLEDRFPNMENIPLERLWQLTPMTKEEDKLRLIRVVHVAVDAELI